MDNVGITAFVAFLVAIMLMFKFFFRPMFKLTKYSNTTNVY